MESTTFEELSFQKTKDQNYLRLSNTNMLLNILKKKRFVSRAELAKIVRMSPTSVTRIVADLQRLGLVRETDLFSSGVGRRAVMLEIVPDSLYTIGVHIDNEFIRVCAVSFSSELLAIERIPFSSSDLQDIICSCFKMYNSIISSYELNPKKIIGAGIGVVGVTDPITRNVLLSPQLSWENAAIADSFEQAFNIPVIIDNDVKASIIGEMNLLGIPQTIDTAMLYLGSGVGSAAYIQGTMIRGKQNAAGEVGHIIVDFEGGKLCECGRIGCLQTHVASKYLIERAQEYDPTINSISKLRLAYDAKSPWALDIIDNCVKYISMAVDVLTAMYNPDQIIIGGALLHDFGSIMPDIIDKFQDTIVVPNISGNTVVMSKYYDVSCSVGGALLAQNTFLADFLKRRI